MTMAARKLSVVICGGGNGAHTLAGIASTKEHVEVTVVDVYQDEAERWTNAMQQHGFCVQFPGGQSLQQEPGDVKFTVCKEYEKVVPQGDVLLIVVPAYTHDIYLSKVVPVLTDECLVVGMPGQPGFEYQCLHYLRKYGKKCPILATETLPWATRISKYGELVEVVGTKEEVEVSLTLQSGTSDDPDKLVQTVQKLLGPKPSLTKVDHQLQLTLSSKANIHPPIMYTQWKHWDGEELSKPPLFYQGVTDESAKCLDAVANEVREIAKEVTRRFPEYDFSGGTSTMHDWLVDHYKDQIDDKTSLKSALQTNQAYNGLVHPMKKTANGKYVPDFSYRYTTEDVPYGLVVLRAIADMVEVKTPVMDEIIVWAQDKLGRQFIVDGKLCQTDRQHSRLPQSYGINRIEELMDFFK